MSITKQITEKKKKTIAAENATNDAQGREEGDAVREIPSFLFILCFENEMKWDGNAKKKTKQNKMNNKKKRLVGFTSSVTN